MQVKGKVTESENLIVNEILDDELRADVFLNNYNPQNPVLDSMRTALFGSDFKTPFWAEESIWNRNFKKKIKKSEKILL